MKTKALILFGPGTNRERDLLEALEAAGGEGLVLPLEELGGRRLADFGLLAIPGGFSYGDALGAGTLLALDLKRRFAEEVSAFVESGRPVIGICNGFQALVKAGILPGDRAGDGRVTLSHNARGAFECRWVALSAPPSASIWTRGLEGLLSCPVAHGEGRIAGDEEALDDLEASGQVALVYSGGGGGRAGGLWPENPNGSARDIAGLCNRAGNVLGLMPHPEDAVRPRARSGLPAGGEAVALRLFANGLAHARA